MYQLITEARSAVADLPGELLNETSSSAISSNKLGHFGVGRRDRETMNPAGVFVGKHGQTDKG